MATKVVTVAFQGVEARRVDVEVQLTPSGAMGGGIVIVGLGDKAVAESRERVRAAFSGMGLALPDKKIVVNLAPADLPKEGSHYDLPIALAILAAMGILPADTLDGWAAIGELSLDGSIVPVAGVLPAAVAVSGFGLGLICPEASGPEAAWAGDDIRILAPKSIIALINHVRGSQVMSPPRPGDVIEGAPGPDLRDVKGQENAKRALEIAAAGGHNLLFSGPPGSGKSMLAQRLPGILPPLSAQELLETSMVHSVAGLIAKGALTRARPFRNPHHSASMAALTGGGIRAKPGEVSLAHNGVLFLDELPEFSTQALDSLRGPLETGEVVVARANAHIRYPARVQLIAAQNPCGRVASLSPLPGTGRWRRVISTSSFPMTMRSVIVSTIWRFAEASMSPQRLKRSRASVTASSRVSSLIRRTSSSARSRGSCSSICWRRSEIGRWRRMKSSFESASELYRS
ncbi:MAG: family ATPase [Caulobacter sp.]|nr:family ATPase [Caulobacter sp.]